MIPNSLITAASFTPNSLQFPSAWLGHLPFAGWVIREVTPKIFVELGTHSGNSYFSFCQSVLEAGISTKCYAVDTWQGDEHAGQYDEEIFTKVNAHHQEHYAGFSRLLRMTFDDAVTYFADESIDLLHIDGLHTYEAVRHDFETWLPKLAPGAVVIFHDTNVSERNFGVWKLWKELQARYSNNLEFVHSHGLGMLQLNNAPNDKRLEWLQPNSPEKLQLINYFAALGSRQFERYELTGLKQHAVNLNQAMTELFEHYELTGLKQHAVNLNQAMTEFVNQDMTELAGQIVGLDQALAERDGQIAALYNSTSWLITRPLRIVSFQIKRANRNALAIIRGVAGKFKNAVLVLNKIFQYIQKNGVKESFLTITYRAKHRRPTIKLSPSTRISLQNILNHLSISLKSEQVLAALINMLGRKRTNRIMANIVDVEKFIFTKNNGHVYPLIHASRLPIPLPQNRKRNILFITAEFPNPHHGGGNRVLNFIKTLSADNNIYLCSAFLTKEHEHILPSLASYCRDIFMIPYGRFGGNQGQIRKWIGSTVMDIVHYEWPRSLENYDAGFGKIQIFTFMEAVSLRLLMDMERLTPLSAIWLGKLEQFAYALRLEFVLTSKVNARIAVTEKDAKFFSNLYPFREYAVLNHGLDFNEFTLPDIEAEPYTLVFVGNYLHYPNAEALEFFFNEIWENIRKEIPDIRIYIVGTNPTDNLLRRSDGKQIIVTGTVADIRPYIQKASVCIAPLISGAGLRGKVIEYAALRRTFVATSIASTDLIFENGIDYFCADTALEFSDKIIALLKDPQLAKRMADCAYETARQNYDNQRLTRFLLSLYEHLENCPDV